MVSETTLMSMPLQGLAASWNQVSSWICASRDRVEGWNSSIHLLMVASAAFARMTPGMAKPAPAAAVDIRNRRRPKCHLVTSLLSLSCLPAALLGEWEASSRRRSGWGGSAEPHHGQKPDNGDNRADPQRLF